MNRYVLERPTMKKLGFIYSLSPCYRYGMYVLCVGIRIEYTDSYNTGYYGKVDEVKECFVGSSYVFIHFKI